MRRQTKIVATLGPACSSEPGIADLIAAGVDVFRLNFSHGTRDEHRETLRRVRDAAARAGRHVAVLQDLSGPKIRTGRLEGGQPLPLAPGDRLRIATGTFEGAAGRVSTAYAELAGAVGAGHRLLLDDGRIELEVESSDGAEIVTRVVDGGVLGENKGINAPGVRLPDDAPTEKDVADLRFGLSLGVDAVALSFVQSAQDLVRARAVIEAAGDPSVPLIAKIERPHAVEAIDDILAACDGVMVARGDLGLELPLEQVPRIQKEITRRARARGMPVIVATQVLDSMRTELRPTRAEVSDAANAVADSVDAIMLSGETAVGEHPTRVVQTLDAIIRDAESGPSAGGAVEPSVIPLEHGRAICEAAVTLAERGAAAAIVAMTRKGRTARVLAAYRPRVPIFAATTRDVVARRLTFYRGVTPLMTELEADADALGFLVEKHLTATGALEPGAVAVFVNVNADLTRTDANFMSIRRVSAP